MLFRKIKNKVPQEANDQKQKQKCSNGDLKLCSTEMDQNSSKEVDQNGSNMDMEKGRIEKRREGNLSKRPPPVPIR